MVRELRPKELIEGKVKVGTCMRVTARRDVNKVIVRTTDFIKILELLTCTCIMC